MNIHQVGPHKPHDTNRFVRFPFDLYRKTPQWVPPLISSALAALAGVGVGAVHVLPWAMIPDAVVRLALAYARHYNHLRDQNNQINDMKTQSRAAILGIIKKELPYLRDHFGVEKVALFGSSARNEAHEDSDIDIIVSLSKPLGFAFIQLTDYLEEKLGRKVDLVTAATIETGIDDPRRAHIALSIQESLIYV